jgi:hypothetical protein
MLLAGKSRLEVAAALGGVSQATIQKYFPGGIRALREKFPDVVIPKRPYRPRPGQKGGGRPRTWTEDQEQQVAELRAQRKTIAEIVEVTGVKRTTVYKILREQVATVQGSPMRLINRAGEELEIGEKVVQARNGRVGKIEGLIEPSPRHPKGAVKVIWSGDSQSTDTLPADIDAAFK